MAEDLCPQARFWGFGFWSSGAAGFQGFGALLLQKRAACLWLESRLCSSMAMLTLDQLCFQDKSAATVSWVQVSRCMFRQICMRGILASQPRAPSCHPSRHMFNAVMHVHTKHVHACASVYTQRHEPDGWKGVIAHGYQDYDHDSHACPLSHKCICTLMVWLPELGAPSPNVWRYLLQISAPVQAAA